VTGAEIAAIVARLASTPFSPRPRRMPPELVGASYLGVRLAEREPALTVHLAQRVLLNAQWAHGTTGDEYLADLRQAVAQEGARLVVYEERGGALAGALAANQIPVERRGVNTRDWVYVAYSADRGTIISGYQASGEHTVRLGENPRWLK
jgi:hypothetical protein